MRVNPEDFEPRYRTVPDGDPWRFATSGYEQGRYERTLEGLDRARYRRAFEPGCAIGELTRRLAERCEQLVAMDPSPTAVAQARRRVGDLPGVDLSIGAIPEDWPSGRFDLLMLSEIGYYFDVDELTTLTVRALACLEDDGQLIAVHWRGHSEDHLLHGDTVHEVLQQVIDRPPAFEVVEPGFRCARWDVR